MKAIFAIGCIFLLMHSVFSQAPTSKEIHDAEIKLRANLLHNYSMDVIPIRKYPVVVDVDLKLILIKDLDSKTQTLSSEGRLKMRWKDYRLTWNTTEYAGINVVRIVPHKVWKPDIELYSRARAEPMTKSEVFVLVYADGKVIWEPPVTIQSLCTVDMTFYPYDKHTCKFIFGSWTFDGFSLDLEIFDKKEIMDFNDLWNKAGEWEIISGTAAKAIAYYACCAEPYTDVKFNVTLQRRSPFYKATIVCPLVVAVTFMLVSLWISPLENSRITLNISSFVVLIAMLMHLSTKLQASGNFCPLIMRFCAVLLHISALITALSASSAATAFSKKDSPIPEWINKILQSPYMKFFCIDVDIKDAASGNKEDTTNSVLEIAPIISSSKATFQLDPWVMFLQIIDRIFFVLFLIIIIASAPS